MKTFPNTGRLIESLAELSPIPDKIQDLYLDFETSSGDAKLDSLNPWHHCKPTGFGITWDNAPGAMYVPLSVPGAAEWLQNVMAVSSTWVNHHVKYDAHVYCNNIGPLPEHLKLKCTIMGAKIVDSDRQYKGGYGLTALSETWLSEDITPYEHEFKPYLYQNKDYGKIPTDIIAPYGCQDVLSNRRLDRYIDAHMHEQCKSVWETEQKLTKILLEVEQYGMRVDPKQLLVNEFLYLNTIMKLDEELAILVGRSFKPNSNDDCYEVLCGQYGLPIAGYTEKGDPSFDKHALAAYIGHPLAPQEVVLKIMQYRQLNTILGLFIVPYQKLNIDGILHGMYNQAVRTGRLSCKAPNFQQLNKAAKEFIIPRPGHAFISIDYSQIEFRLMMHYIKDSEAIAAFHKNPDTDFHVWVAEMCGIKRRPAKTVNFMIGFGAGKRKVVKVLSAIGDVIADITAQVEKLDVRPEHHKMIFNKLCEERGLHIYNKYHATLPGIRRTSQQAAATAYRKGYVYDVYGRHRHLPPTKCHIAFNTVNQASAADLMKERMVAVHEMIQGTPIKICASVHDEILFEAPIEIAEDPRTQRDLVACLENPSVELRVPIRCSIGVSSKNWREAGSDENAKPLSYDRKTVGNLDHLKN